MFLDFDLEEQLFEARLAVAWGKVKSFVAQAVVSSCLNVREA